MNALDFAIVQHERRFRRTMRAATIETPTGLHLNLETREVDKAFRHSLAMRSLAVELANDLPDIHAEARAITAQWATLVEQARAALALGAIVVEQRLGVAS